MSPAHSRLLEQALRLSDQERGDLAARLIDSLDPSIDDADAETTWDSEIRERLDDLDQGRVQPVSWAEARRMIAEESPTDASDAD
jgi:putative addiction module component (TIGR02574 family)